ncbi:MAG: alpha/beta hydrolase [Sandaracinaceae bacterium]|nr:alpha/beta hydrolase [Sandaracinaceae bacterium]
MYRVLRAVSRLPEALQVKLLGGPIEIDGQRMDGPSQILNALAIRRSANIADATPEEARAGMSEIKRIAPPPAVGRIEDRRIPGPGGRLAVRAYYPDRAHEAALPGLVWYHGGGWVLGTLDGHDYVCSCLAARANAVVVSVDYRLAPEHRYPAAVDDAEASWRHVVEHADDFGIDPARVAIGGDSAGGNLAAAVCLRVARAGGPAPRLQLLVYPVTDLTKESPSYQLFDRGFLLSRAGMRWFIDHYVPDPRRRAEPDASPLLADDLTGLPPAHVVIAGFDPLRDEGVAYAERLRDAGVAVELATYPSSFHGFFSTGFAVPVGDEAVDRAARALREAL